MAIKLYFETLTGGMHAKLNSRYAARKPVLETGDGSSPSKDITAKASRTGYMEDAIKKPRFRVS